MRDIRTILLPIDSSGGSHAAIDYAAELAQQLGARIDVVHVWRPPHQSGHYIDQFTVVEQGQDKTVVEYLAERAQQTLDEAAARLSKHANDGDTTFRSRLEEGAPADVIVELAGSGRYELVVMGTQGRRGIERLLLGSVTEAVVRGAAVPVLTVHSRQTEPRATGDVTATG